MSSLGDDLKAMQEFMIAELVKTRATLEALMETLDGFNIIDLQCVEDLIEEFEQKILMEYTQEEEEEDEEPEDGEEFDFDEYDTQCLIDMGR